MCVKGEITMVTTGYLREFRAGAPAFEYSKIGMFWGNIINVIRLSMGDYSLINGA